VVAHLAGRIEDDQRAEAPGAPAITSTADRRDDSSSRTPHEYNYVREKIFTEEGRKYADVEIPFFSKNRRIFKH